MFLGPLSGLILKEKKNELNLMWATLYIWINDKQCREKDQPEAITTNAILNIFLRQQQHLKMLIQRWKKMIEKEMNVISYLFKFSSSSFCFSFIFIFYCSFFFKFLIKYFEFCVILFVFPQKTK